MTKNNASLLIIHQVLVKNRSAADTKISSNLNSRKIADAVHMQSLRSIRRMTRIIFSSVDVAQSGSNEGKCRHALLGYLLTTPSNDFSAAK